MQCRVLHQPGYWGGKRITEITELREMQICDEMMKRDDLLEIREDMNGAVSCDRQF